MSFLTRAVSKTKKKLGNAINKTVSAGDQLVSSTINKTVSAGGQLVNAGENLVIGKPPGRTSSGSSSLGSPSDHRRKKGSRTKSPMRVGSRGGRKSRGAKDEGISDEVHMFCSVMYSHDFVVDAAKQVESNTSVSSLTLEDLIQRNEAETTQVIVDLLADNFYNSSTDKKATGGKRIWTSIVFVDCISDPDSYKAYLDLKEDFMSKMERQLKMKGMSSTKHLPIKFEAKIELHTLLDVYGVIQLLQEVERDTSVKAVKFPGFHGNDEEIAEAFTQLVDPTSMEWKETVIIKVKYSRSDNKHHGSGSSPTALVGECARALETTMFSASMVGESGAFDFDPADVSHLKTSRASTLGPFDDEDSVTEVSLFESEHSNSLRKGSDQSNPLRVAPMSPLAG